MFHEVFKNKFSSVYTCVHDVTEEMRKIPDDATRGKLPLRLENNSDRNHRYAKTDGPRNGRFPFPGHYSVLAGRCYNLITSGRA